MQLNNCLEMQKKSNLLFKMLSVDGACSLLSIGYDLSESSKTTTFLCLFEVLNYDVTNHVDFTQLPCTDLRKLMSMFFLKTSHEHQNTAILNAFLLLRLCLKIKFLSTAPVTFRKL